MELLVQEHETGAFAELMHRDWIETLRREGASAPLPQDGELRCPACGSAAPLIDGACPDCGLQLA